MEKKRKQIVFDVSEEFHKKIKMIALLKGETMTYWIHKAILEKIKRENKE